MKALLWILTLIWFLGSWYWYVCPHKNVCPWGRSGDGGPVGEVVDDNAAATRPLTFSWSEGEAITSDRFGTFRDSVLGTLGDEDLLEITGRYFSDEENNTSFDNLGLARADAVVQKLSSILDADRMTTKGALMDGRADEARNALFEAIGFRRVIRNESVREVEGKMIINFPHASADMLENQKLIRYLDDLVVRLGQTEERVQLVGHTDSSASAGRNMRLGQMRADAIKDILVSKGINASRILTESRGETQPIATNNTQAGMQKNRRVELTILP